MAKKLKRRVKELERRVADLEVQVKAALALAVAFDSDESFIPARVACHSNELSLDNGHDGVVHYEHDERNECSSS